MQLDSLSIQMTICNIIVVDNHAYGKRFLMNAK
jgi:hypothetical protein